MHKKIIPTATFIIGMILGITIKTTIIGTVIMIICAIVIAYITIKIYQIFEKEQEEEYNTIQEELRKWK